MSAREKFTIVERRSVFTAERTCTITTPRGRKQTDGGKR